MSWNPTRRHSVQNACFACLIIAAATILSGCGPGVRAGDAESLTGGVAIWMKVSDQRTSHALYIVEPDGLLRFGGGFPAARNETEWEGAINRDEADALRSALADAGWFNGRPTTLPVSGLDDADARQHEIRFAWPGGSWTLKSDTGGGGVRPVREFLLDLITAKRHGHLFDQLPEAGQRRQN